MSHKLIIYTDGGARGNPGPAAVGVVITAPSTSSGQEKHYSQTIGNATNNVAEYRALILALTKAEAMLGAAARETDLEVRADSELMVKQLLGQYKVKDQNLKLLFADAVALKEKFRSVSFVHIPREQNSVADALVNEALDALPPAH